MEHHNFHRKDSHFTRKFYLADNTLCNYKNVSKKKL